MALVSRFDEYQQGHPGVGFPIAVLYKFIDDNGSYLAALITYYAFVSLFPLLLLATAVLGFVLHGDNQLQHRLLTSGLGEFPVVGSQLQDPKRLGGGAGGIIIGILGAAYGGLGVAQAAQYAMNTAWRVPRNDRPNPFKARGRSVLLLATVGSGVIATSALSSVVTTSAGSLGLLSKAVALVASIALNAVVFVFAFRVATARALTLRHVAPGAITAAILWQLLQSFGAAYVTHVVKNSSATNSVFALVLGLLGFLYVSSTAVVISVEINVVRVEHLYPRSLLTPFTDDVQLTGGDERSYTSQAEAQRNKGFQTISVDFAGQDPNDGDTQNEDPPAQPTH